MRRDAESVTRAGLVSVSRMNDERVQGGLDSLTVMKPLIMGLQSDERTRKL